MSNENKNNPTAPEAVSLRGSEARATQTKGEFFSSLTKAADMSTPISKIFDPTLLTERAQSVTKYDLLKLMARDEAPETSDLTLKDIYSINSAIYKEFAGDAAGGNSALHTEESIHACCCTTTVCCCCSASSVDSPSVKSTSNR